MYRHHHHHYRRRRRRRRRRRQGQKPAWANRSWTLRVERNGDEQRPLWRGFFSRARYIECTTALINENDRERWYKYVYNANAKGSVTIQRGERESERYQRNAIIVALAFHICTIALTILLYCITLLVIFNISLISILFSFLPFHKTWELCHAVYHHVPSSFHDGRSFQLYYVYLFARQFN